MAKKILIMGLSGSGKTYFAQRLIDFLKVDDTSLSIDWFNADKIREKFNDWDFSIEGRIRQSIRMSDLANCSEKSLVIADFIAPLAQMRANYNPDLIIWMDTVDSSKFSNTDKIFETPLNVDFHIKEKDSDRWVPLVGGYIKQNLLNVSPIVKIIKWPVVLVATYRSGSTALGHSLSKFYNCDWYSEPLVNKNNTLKKFKNHYHSTNNTYLLKTMIDQIPELAETKNICYSQDSFKIRLIRKDTVAHILSLYLARIRNIWVEFESAKNYTVDIIDTVLLKRSIDHVMRFNQMIKNTDINFDQTVYYEDFDNIKYTFFKKTTQPTNYDYLYQLIKERLEDSHDPIEFKI